MSSLPSSLPSMRLTMDTKTTATHSHLVEGFLKKEQKRFSMSKGGTLGDK